jgi:hypothetical protein
VDDELLALLKARPQVFFTMTLFGPGLTTYGPPPAWLDEPAIHEDVPADAIAQLKGAMAARTPAALEAAREEFQRLGRNITALNAAGVRLALGTDVGGASAGGLFGWTEHVELEHMVAAGLTPAQAIAAGTQHAAGVLHLDDLGRLRPARAPASSSSTRTRSIASRTRRIARVYMRGEEVPRTRSNRAEAADAYSVFRSLRVRWRHSRRRRTRSRPCSGSDPTVRCGGC